MALARTSPPAPELKCAEFGTRFAKFSQAEHLEVVQVLSFDDECCEGMGFARSHEKIRQGLAERLCVLCASASSA